MQALADNGNSCYYVLVKFQRRYDTCYGMLTQRALFCIDVMTKRVTLSQHFMTHVVPPLVKFCYRLVLATRKAKSDHVYRPHQRTEHAQYRLSLLSSCKILENPCMLILCSLVPVTWRSDMVKDPPRIRGLLFSMSSLSRYEGMLETKSMTFILYHNSSGESCCTSCSNGQLQGVFQVMYVCGIPAITLQGTVRDWEVLFHWTSTI
jgi:hypothetical protein